jgi:hypothetical protein
MATQRYSVTPHPIETLLTWVKSGEIAIPEIQRPFVWGATKVRNLLDFLYQGCPVCSLIAWRNPTVKLKDVNDDLYDPTYTDMLRVAFTSEFGRGKLQDLVALLSGRNFATKQYEESIAEASFAKLKQGVLAFMTKTHFDRIVMILKSAGFVTRDLIRSRNAINFAYILYLRGRSENLPAPDIESLVRRWFAMSILRGRYSGSPETAFDLDIRSAMAASRTWLTCGPLWR